MCKKKIHRKKKNKPKRNCQQYDFQLPYDVLFQRNGPHGRVLNHDEWCYTINEK